MVLILTSPLPCGVLFFLLLSFRSEKWILYRCAQNFKHLSCRQESEFLLCLHCLHPLCVRPHPQVNWWSKTNLLLKWRLNRYRSLCQTPEREITKLNWARTVTGPHLIFSLFFCSILATTRMLQLASTWVLCLCQFEFNSLSFESFDIACDLALWHFNFIWHWLLNFSITLLTHFTVSSIHPKQQQNTKLPSAGRFFAIHTFTLFLLLFHRFSFSLSLYSDLSFNKLMALTSKTFYGLRSLKIL